jgi:hypothetical protein
MTRPTAVRLLSVAAYLAGVLIVFEGASRAALSVDALFARAAGGDEASWRLRWVRRRGAQPSMHYAFDEHHPLRGWALKPNLRGVPAFGHARLSSTSRGARGAREHAVPKPPGTLRILVFGDSFTFGEDVGDDETYAACLERLLPGVEVVNLGVHGYGHDQMLLYLQEVGARYAPDVVLLGFLYDDMERNLLRFRDFAKPRYELAAGRLVLEGTPVPTPDDVVAGEWRRSRFADLLTMLDQRFRWRTGRSQREMEELTTAILDEFRRVTEAIGARPAYAYLPVYGEITKPEMSMTRREQFFFRYCRSRGIQSMYLRPYFLPKVKAGVEFKTYGHWGPLEHATAAEGIRAYLVEKGLLSPPDAPSVQGIRPVATSRAVRAPSSRTAATSARATTAQPRPRSESFASVSPAPTATGTMTK